MLTGFPYRDNIWEKEGGDMLTFKIDVLQELKDRGYTTYILRERQYLSETSIAHLRKGEMVSIKAVNAICCMLHKKPADILDFSVSDEEKLKYYI